MEWAEATGIVWETLAKAEHPLSILELENITGHEAAGLRRALVTLRDARLVGQSSAKPASYHAVRELDALRWAKGVDVGIPLSVLEAHARLPAKERREALALAASGQIALIDQERVDLRRAEREQYLAGRAATRAAATDLGRLVADTKEAANQARKATPRTQTVRDRAVQLLLDAAAEEAERALKILSEQLR